MLKVSRNQKTCTVRSCTPDGTTFLSVRSPPYQALCTTDRSVNIFLGDESTCCKPLNEFCLALARKRLPDVITGTQGTTNLPSRFNANPNGVSSPQYIVVGKPPVASKAARVQ